MTTPIEDLAKSILVESDEFSTRMQTLADDALAKSQSLADLFAAKKPADDAELIRRILADPKLKAKVLALEATPSAPG